MPVKKSNIPFTRPKVEKNIKLPGSTLDTQKFNSSTASWTTDSNSPAGHQHLQNASDKYDSASSSSSSSSSSSASSRDKISSCIIPSDTVDSKVRRPLARNFRFAATIKDWGIQFFSFLLAPNVVKDDPFDTLVLRAHYSFAAKLMFALFLFSTSSWNAEEPIICVDMSDRSTPSESILDYCLSYPYTETAVDGSRYDFHRHYALHYRWIHISLLILSFVYKGVSLAIKALGYKGLREMLDQLHRCDLFEDGFQIALSYYKNYKGRHGRMYTKFVIIHILSLTINVLAFLGLNIALQNQYWNLPKQLAVERDPGTFDDPFSLIFPPFVKCEITPDQHILIEREKRYGCRLTLMEVYEKIFMILWFFQVFLAVWNLIFLLLNFPIPYLHCWRVRLLLEGGAHARFNPFQKCAKEHPVSELFAFGRVQNILPGCEYVKLLQAMEHDEIHDPDDTLYEDQDDQKQSQQPQFYSRKSPLVGFEALQADAVGFNSLSASTYQMNLLGTPAGRRNSGSFDFTSHRQSMGFDAQNVATSSPCNDGAQQSTNFFTPLKSDKLNNFFTPRKETPDCGSSNVVPSAPANSDSNISCSSSKNQGGTGTLDKQKKGADRKWDYTENESWD